jgi:pimeloyl-ACP methyl ester carboxylesterase
VFRRSTPAYRLRSGEERPGSLATLSRVELGGLPQWILARGVDRTQPLLLFLHGGPGNPQISVARLYQRELERAFLVVNWDQRGCGLSYQPGIDRATMTIDRMVDDTVELSRLLLDRFGHEKLFLLGHSWGTVLGLLAAQRAPELYHGYVGAAQVVDPSESEERLRKWTLAEARRRGWKRAVRELEAMGEGPYTSDRSFQSFRRWADRLGGRAGPGTNRRLIVDSLFRSSEYSLRDLLAYPRGERFSVSCLLDEAARVDMASRVPHLKVPAYFISGRHDRIVDPALAREYLRVLEAPRKGWAWIEDAAHMAPFEQPDAFAAAVAAFSRQDPLTAPPRWSMAA